MATTIIGNTALHIACEKDYLEMVKYLVDKGANINIKNNEGYLPSELRNNVIM